MTLNLFSWIDFKHFVEGLETLEPHAKEILVGARAMQTALSGSLAGPELIVSQAESLIAAAAGRPDMQYGIALFAYAFCPGEDRVLLKNTLVHRVLCSSQIQFAQIRDQMSMRLVTE